MSPAAWVTELSPATIILEQASPELAALKVDQIIAGWAAVLDQTTDGLRHLVLATPHGPLRLCIDNSPPDAGLNCVIQTDDLITVRIAALQWFHHSIRGSSSLPGPNCLFPTPFQRSRLNLMLRTLDYVADNAGNPNPIREVSQLIVYPRTEFASAAEWKTSSERRRTQRLAETVAALNDRLHASRCLDPDLFQECGLEIEQIAAEFQVGSDKDALRHRLIAYHERRKQAASQYIRALGQSVD